MGLYRKYAEVTYTTQTTNSLLILYKAKARCEKCGALPIYNELYARLGEEALRPIRDALWLMHTGGGWSEFNRVMDKLIGEYKDNTGSIPVKL